MMIRFLAIWLFAASGFAVAQLSQLEATRIAESILSNQNPLILIKEIGHNGLVIQPEGNGYRVKVQGPRLPGRETLISEMTFTLLPVDDDLVQVQLIEIPRSGQMADGAEVAFTLNGFQGLFSRRDQGFESMQMGMSNLSFDHPSAQISLDRFQSSLSYSGGRYVLELVVRGFDGVFADVFDADEAVETFTLRMGIDEGGANGGDLLFIANSVFALLVDSNEEIVNTLAPERELPSDLMGLDFQISMENYASVLRAQMDDGTSRTLADLTYGSVFLTSEVLELADGTGSLDLRFGITDMQGNSPESLISGAAETFATQLIVRGVNTQMLAQLFSDEEGAQTAALGNLLGNFSRMELRGVAKALEVQQPSSESFLTLGQGDFRFQVDSPYADIPNAKNMVIELDISNLDLASPDITEAYEPAWSLLMQPALPEEFDLRLSIFDVAPSIWQGLASLAVDVSSFPSDRATLETDMRLQLDGSRFISNLLNAQLDGELVFAEGAALFALGNIDLTMSPIRPLIGLVQQSARTPDRSIGQILGLGAAGMAALSRFAQRTDDGQEFYRFEFQDDGLPTINGQPLPFSF